MTSVKPSSCILYRLADAAAIETSRMRGDVVDAAR
jgi:hypothetical protein